MATLTMDLLKLALCGVLLGVVLMACPWPRADQLWRNPYFRMVVAALGILSAFVYLRGLTFHGRSGLVHVHEREPGGRHRE